MKKNSTHTRNRLSGRVLGFALFLAISLMTFTAQSQSIFSIVGNGNTSNSSTGYPAPFGNFYYGSRHQMRVTAAELISAGMAPGANITSVGFNITAINGASPMLNWQVAVYTTTATDPLVSGYLNTGVVSVSTFTTVNGPLGWYQTPIPAYVWNGTSNLVIEACQVNPNGYTYNYSTVWTTTLTGSEVKSRWTQQDLVTSCPNQFSSTSLNTRPDIRFEWNYLSPCSGIPTSNSIVTPTFAICPNVAFGAIGLSSTYTTSGLTYQWMQSTTSNVGPFAPVPSNGTGWTYSVPGLTTTTYYQAVITCTNSGQSFTTTGSPVQVAATTTNSVPYFEGFENIGMADRLPNCSWWAANQGTTVKTYTSSQSNNRLPRTGNSFATFNLPSNNNAMYTNGIYMQPGITYSAACYYSTEYFGYSNWSNLTLSFGTTQTLTGQTNIAVASPAISGPYKLLSGTFTVSTPGLYYIGIRATGSTGNAAYLNIDDISVTIPCTPGSGNSPAVTLGAGSQTVCAGDLVSLNASGADTYSWNTNATGATTNHSPAKTFTYMVTGTNTLTNCSATQSLIVYVNPSPTVIAAASSPSICAGDVSYLTGIGALNYAWSTGGTGNIISVSPTSSTTYSLIGTNSFGCPATATVQVAVKQAPTISASSAVSGMVCVGDLLQLNATGGVSYQWYSSSSSALLNGSSVNVQLNTNTTFTVVGVGANGCSAKATLVQNVDACTSISEAQALLAGVRVYPNPTTGLFTIELKSGTLNSVAIIDVTGRKVMETSANSSAVNIDLTELANGVYYATIQSEKGSAVVRLVKN